MVGRGNPIRRGWASQETCLAATGPGVEKLGWEVQGALAVCASVILRRRRGGGQWQAGGGLSSLDVQRIQVVVFICFILYDVASLGVFSALRVSMAFA